MHLATGRATNQPDVGRFIRSFPISAGSPDHGIQRNLELRILRVVTLCSLRPTTALLRRGGRPTMRYDATGCPLRAETLLAALFEASSPIHEDRNGLPQPIERMEVSRHLIDMLGCDLE